MSSDFRVIGFTLPESKLDLSLEAGTMAEYLDSGAVNLFHIRKPLSDEADVIALLNAIPERLHPQLILHSHFHLFGRYDFAGVHIKDESRELIRSDKLKTRSCHSLPETTNEEPGVYEYSFLSPVFDSISKEGYLSPFSESLDEVTPYAEKYPLIALGGVTPEKFYKLRRLKFAGAALLGYLWNPNLNLHQKIDNLINLY